MRPRVVVRSAGAAVAISPTTFGLNQGLNGASSGRAGPGHRRARAVPARPVWGYGSGSFENEYEERHQAPGRSSASHTIPITIAAEQGLIGEFAYLALVVAALITLLRGPERIPCGWRSPPRSSALVFHTLLYADFLEDPITWTLLAIGVALARRPTRPHRGGEVVGGEGELQQQLA